MEKLLKYYPEDAAPQTLYDLMKSPDRMPAKQALDDTLDVAAYAVYEQSYTNKRTGELVEMTCMSVKGEDGRCCVTNSTTAISEFLDAVEFYAGFGLNPKSVTFVQRRGKNNDYITVVVN